MPGRLSMKNIRDAVRRQLGTEDPVAEEFDPRDLVRFSPNLPETLPDGEQKRLRGEAAELGPWLQGPFLLGGDVVVGGVWRNDLRWTTLAPELPASLAGMRVLDVGTNAGYDAFMFKLLEGDEVVAVEPFGFIEQARFLESIYRSGVDLQQIGWQDLDPDRHGRFDMVHCHGVLYHELSPFALLERLYEMTEPGGTLFLGSMMLPEPELAEYARFIPGSYFEDETWWWVPGRDALRGMIEAAGFRVEARFGEGGGPAGEFPVITGYFRALRPD
jgi:SAM-dependent methyltransferase